MKFNKTITVLAAVIGLAAVSNAEVIYITGSTAFRAQEYQGLLDMGLTAVQPTGASSSSSTITYTGTVGNTLPNGTALASHGHALTVYASYAGSGSGCSIVAHKASPTYLTTAGANTTYANGADLAFCDVFQSSTTTPTPALDELASVDGTNSSAGAGMAVVCFTWAASADCAGTIKNITEGNISDLINGGSETKSFITGSTNDTATVFLTGRDNDSGTRITAELDCNQATGAFDPSQGIQQYTINGNNNTPVAGGHFAADAFNSGYSSGGNVVKALNVVGAGQALGYVSMSDASALANGAIPVSYLGINPITGGAWTGGNNAATPWNFQAIEAGAYPFWSYEHMYYDHTVNALNSFTIQTFGNDFINAIQYEITHPAAGVNQSADLISNMKVHRTGDGGFPLAGN